MKRKNEQSTRELMGTKELSDYSIRTYRKDELVYFLIQPSNLSVIVGGEPFRKNLWTHDGIKRHHRNRDDVLKFP